MPYTLAASSGAWLFRRRGDAHDRVAAYVVVAAAALSGLPLFG